MSGGITIAEAWEAAVEVTASAYRLDPSMLRAESRGRGPRPPRHVWEAKKLCVYIAVAASGCGYKHLGDQIGLHKDTVCSHCADVRDQAADDPDFETRTHALTELALQRLSRPEPPPSPPGVEITLSAMWAVLDVRLGRIEALLARLAAHPTVSDEIDLHPTGVQDHGNVIKIAIGGSR